MNGAAMINEHKQEEFNSNIEGRVGRLEGVVESLAHEIKQVSSDMRSLIDRLNGFSEEVSTKIGQATSPKWPLIASIGSLITTTMIMAATLIAFIFSGQADRISNNENDIVTMNSTIDGHKEQMAYFRGQNDEWKTHVNRRFTDLDTILQREMRLLNETMNERVIALDDKLQHEFNGTLKHHEAGIESLKNWQLEHTKEASERFGRLDTVETQIDNMCKDSGT